MVVLKNAYLLSIRLYVSAINHSIIANPVAGNRLAEEPISLLKLHKAIPVCRVE